MSASGKAIKPSKPPGRSPPAVSTPVQGKKISGSAKTRKVVYIYGGMHKTGSSYNQNTLYQNRALLNAAGVEIVQTGLETHRPTAGVRHFRLSQEFLKLGKPDALWQEVAQEISNGPFARYILMHETFFGPDISPALLQKALPDVQLRVVACVRNPIDYMNSFYKERVYRAGEFRELKSFIAKNASYLKVEKLRIAWEAALGKRNVKILSYEAGGHDMKRTVLKALLARSKVRLEDLELSERVNVALDHRTTLEYLMANKLRWAGLNIPKDLIAASPGLKIQQPKVSRILSDEDIEQILRLSDMTGDVVKTSAVAALPIDKMFHDAAVRRRLARALVTESVTLQISSTGPGTPNLHQQDLQQVLQVTGAQLDSGAVSSVKASALWLEYARAALGLMHDPDLRHALDRFTQINGAVARDPLTAFTQCHLLIATEAFDDLLPSILAWLENDKSALAWNTEAWQAAYRTTLLGSRLSLAQSDEATARDLLKTALEIKAMRPADQITLSETQKSADKHNFATLPSNTPSQIFSDTFFDEFQHIPWRSARITFMMQFRKLRDWTTKIPSRNASRDLTQETD